MVRANYMIVVHPYHRSIALQSFHRLKCPPSGEFDSNAIDQRQVMQDTPARLFGHLLPSLPRGPFLKDDDLSATLHWVGERYPPEDDQRHSDIDEKLEPSNLLHATFLSKLLCHGQKTSLLTFLRSSP
jgi:hypothetical protein